MAVIYASLVVPVASRSVSAAAVRESCRGKGDDYGH